MADGGGREKAPCVIGCAVRSCATRGQKRILIEGLLLQPHAQIYLPKRAGIADSGVKTGRISLGVRVHFEKDLHTAIRIRAAVCIWHVNLVAAARNEAEKLSATGAHKGKVIDMAQ